MRIAAVVLAAGASRRLGEPKQLVRLGGERLLERAVRVAREAGCDPVLVVLGCGAERIAAECALGAAQVVMNEDWAEGMGASIRVGVATLPEDVDGAVVMTCDQPAVTADHLGRLIDAGGDAVAASAYVGRGGVPAFFRARYFAELLQLRGDAGARALLETAVAVELRQGELDVDTPDDRSASLEPVQAVHHYCSWAMLSESSASTFTSMATMQGSMTIRRNAAAIRKLCMIGASFDGGAFALLTD